MARSPNIRRTRDSEGPDLIFRGRPAVVGREMEGESDEEDTVDFEVRLSTDFRRPLWGGTFETLSHEDSAVLRDYVDEGMSYVQVRSHYSGERPGKLLEKSLRIKKEGPLRVLVATARLVDDGAAGTTQIRRWRQGVDTNLSIDYEWREWVIREDSQKDETDIIVESWRLRGVSVVGDPADEEVGVADKRTRQAVEDEIVNIRKETGSKRMRRDESGTTDPANPNDPPNPSNRDINPSGGDANPSGGDANPSGRDANPSGGDVNPAEPRDPEPDNRSRYDRMTAQIEADRKHVEDAISERSLSAEARTHIDQLHANARGRLNVDGTYEAGSYARDAFRFLATHRQGGIRESEEFRVDGDQLVRDPRANPMVRSMADAYAHLSRSRGAGYDFASGAFDAARGLRGSRNAGALAEFNEGVLGSMVPEIQNLFRNAAGPMIPPDMVLRMLKANPRLQNKEARERIEKAMRAFTVSGDSGGKGGNLVQTDVLVEEFVDALYATAHSSDLGVRMLMGATSKIQIPTQTSKVTEAWLTESGALTLSDATIGAVTAEPHRIAAGADVTFQLGIQVGGVVDDIVLGMLQDAIDEAMDTAFLSGAATGNDPTGVINVSGVSTGNVSFASGGAAARFAACLALANALLENNVPTGMFKWSLAAEAVDNLKASPRDTAGGSGGYIMGKGDLFVDYPAYPTTILSGDSANDKFAVLSDWTHSWIVVFGMPILTEDPYTRAPTGEKRMIVTCFMDHIITQALRFVVGNLSAV